MALILKYKKGLDKKALSRRYKRKAFFYKFMTIIALLEAIALYIILNK